MRMNAFTASLLARKSIQAQHQRQGLGLNERVFMVFVITFAVTPGVGHVTTAISLLKL